MWRMLQADEPDDYVVATGTAISVREFVQVAFERVGLDWAEYVRFDDRYLRPSEVDSLVGDASRAEQRLGWKPATFPVELAQIMVDADVAQLAGGPIDRPYG
jgi:GDPmannose 4,6-dehydratase